MCCTFSSSRRTSAWLFKRSGPCLTGKGQCCQEAGGLEGYGPSDGSQDCQNRGKIICMPQMWSPWGKRGRAGTGREPCPSSTHITEEQRGQGCPILLSFTSPSGLGSGKPAPWKWFNVRKRATVFSMDRAESHTVTLPATPPRGRLLEPQSPASPLSHA